MKVVVFCGGAGLRLRGYPTMFPSPIASKTTTFSTRTNLFPTILSGPKVERSSTI
jgi:hypothetical protein